MSQNKKKIPTVRNHDSILKWSIRYDRCKLSRLENTRSNEEILPTQSLIIPDISNHIDENQELWYPEDFNQESISSHKLELDHFQTLDKLASFLFNEIELECKCDPDP